MKGKAFFFSKNIFANAERTKQTFPNVMCWFHLKILISFIDSFFISLRVLLN
jgi:hypothetical protein